MRSPLRSPSITLRSPRFHPPLYPYADRRLGLGPYRARRASSRTAYHDGARRTWLWHPPRLQTELARHALDLQGAFGFTDCGFPTRDASIPSWPCGRDHVCIPASPNRIAVCRGIRWLEYDHGPSSRPRTQLAVTHQPHASASPRVSTPMVEDQNTDRIKSRSHVVEDLTPNHRAMWRCLQSPHTPGILRSRRRHGRWPMRTQRVASSE
jgi:hypothetical protein